MSLSVLEITYVVQCLCLKDDDNIDPIRGEANYGQSDTRKEKDETLDQMTQAVKALQQQVLHLANQLATASAPNVKVEPTPVPRVRQERTSVHVKAEPNALATTIDLVSSDARWFLLLHCLTRKQRKRNYLHRKSARWFLLLHCLTRTQRKRAYLHRKCAQ